MLDHDRISTEARRKHIILYDREVFWRDHYAWLLEQGYLLRDRYKPDWVYSWKGKPDKLDCAWADAEDGAVILDSRVGDAVRQSDGAYVGLKRVDIAYDPRELQVSTKFSSPPLSSDPRKHCVPIYDILKLPDKETQYLLVMPLLRVYDDPSWDSIGEMVALWEQIFEGIHFMHINHTAHRDCTNNNVMLDPRIMYPDSFHPAEPSLRRDFKGLAEYRTRTECRPRYYLIDLGLACVYPPEDGPPCAYPVEGGDHTVPEFADHPEDPYDPFATDVYYLGNWIKTHFVQKYYRLEFIENLVDDMTQRDPTERPTMDEVIARFEVIVQGLSTWRLRSRVVRRTERYPNDAVRRAFGHWKRKALFTITGTPAIPRPGPGRPPSEPAISVAAERYLSEPESGSALS